MRTLFALGVVALMVLAGCGGGGERTHDITTPYSGAVYGVETVPQDSETDAPTDSWVHVYWPEANYPPPAEFTVRMEAESDGDWDSVRTKLREDHSDPDGGSWWFEPGSDLAAGTWHRVTITDNAGRRSVLCFRTEGSGATLSRATRSGAASIYRPEGADKPAPAGTKEAVEHTIRLGR